MSEVIIKKPFYKKTWFIVLAVVIVIIVLVNAGNTGETNSSKSEVNTEQAEETQEKKGNLDKEHFNMIKIGMTLSEVEEILGEDGELQSETGGEEYKLEVYQWIAGFLDSKVVIIMLENGKVSNKTQTGM